MSRLAKIAQTHILTQQPQKPSDEGFEFGAELTPERNIKKQNTTVTAATQEDFEQFQRSSLQNGAAKKIQKLFLALRSEDLGLSRNSRAIRSSHVVANSSAESHEAITSRNPDAIQLGDYLDRFFEFGGISDEVVTVAYIYLRRALDNDQSIRSQHMHKLIAGCLLLAHKFLIETCFWSMEDFGCLSGVSAVQMKNIEDYTAGFVLEYSLFVSKKDFTRAKNTLLSYSY